jgi:hypothetical protein
VAGALLISVCVSAQAQTRGASGVTTVAPEKSEVLPFEDFRYKGNVGRTIEDSEPPQFPKLVRPPKGAPNIVLILIDDAGYGQFGTFGGQVPTPALDRVAAAGLRYTRFHYQVGDNGASAEGGLVGLLNENSFFNGVAESLEDNLKAMDELAGPVHRDLYRHV